MTYNELKIRFKELFNRSGRGSIKAKDILTLIIDLIDKIMGIDVSATATIRKSYNTLTEANADKQLIDTETNKPLKIGQLVSVVADPDVANNAIYRLASISANGTPTWERQAPLGDMSQYAKSGGLNKTLKEINQSIIDVEKISIGGSYKSYLMDAYYVGDGKFNSLGVLTAVQSCTEHGYIDIRDVEEFTIQLNIDTRSTIVNFVDKDRNFISNIINWGGVGSYKTKKNNIPYNAAYLCLSYEKKDKEYIWVDIVTKGVNTKIKELQSGIDGVRFIDVTHQTINSANGTTKITTLGSVNVGDKIKINAKTDAPISQTNFKIGVSGLKELDFLDRDISKGVTFDFEALRDFNPIPNINVVCTISNGIGGVPISFTVEHAAVGGGARRILTRYTGVRGSDSFCVLDYLKSGTKFRVKVNLNQGSIPSTETKIYLKAADNTEQVLWNKYRLGVWYDYVATGKHNILSCYYGNAQKIDFTIEIEIEEEDYISITEVSDNAYLEEEETRALSIRGARKIVEASYIHDSAYAKSLHKDKFIKGVHLDCGRKYFSPANIKKLIDNMHSAQLNTLQLYFSDNNALRLGLDDMRVWSPSEGIYYDLSKALGNRLPNSNYSNKWITQSEMDDIIKYAGDKGIEIIPAFDLPGHALNIYIALKADVYRESGRAKLLNALELYVKYFASRGCRYFNICGDESNIAMEHYEPFINRAMSIICGNHLVPIIYNDEVCKNGFLDPYINTGAIVIFWNANKDRGFQDYRILAEAGYRLMSCKYWVLGVDDDSDTYVDGVRTFNPYRLAHKDNIHNNIYGTMFHIWCDAAGLHGATDEGELIIQQTARSIEAFGDAIKKVSSTAIPSSIRPHNANVGQSFFDTTLNKPIWWVGTYWVDSDSNKV